MKLPIRIIALTFALLAAMAASAQTSTYAIGAAPCSPGGSDSISCSGVPLSLAGEAPATFWIADRDYPVSHFIVFSGTTLGGSNTAQINQDASYQPTYSTVTATRNGITKTANEITSLSITYYGTDANGDAYQGAMVLSFDWYYVWTCSGRGCGGTLGWHKRVTGGSTTFSIAAYYGASTGGAAGIALPDGLIQDGINIGWVGIVAHPESPIAPTPTCIDQTVGHCKDPQ